MCSCRSHNSEWYQMCIKNFFFLFLLSRRSTTLGNVYHKCKSPVGSDRMVQRYITFTAEQPGFPFHAVVFRDWLKQGYIQDEAHWSHWKRITRTSSFTLKIMMYIVLHLCQFFCFPILFSPGSNDLQSRFNASLVPGLKLFLKGFLKRQWKKTSVKFTSRAVSKSGRSLLRSIYWDKLLLPFSVPGFVLWFLRGAPVAHIWTGLW